MTKLLARQTFSLEDAGGSKLVFASCFTQFKTFLLPSPQLFKTRITLFTG